MTSIKLSEFIIDILKYDTIDDIIEQYNEQRTKEMFANTT